MSQYDVIIVGAGAAGLFAGIFAGQAGARVLLLDGATKLGAKILVAGGGRCNVTNVDVSPSKFHGVNAEPFVARVLRGFSVEQTHRFFESRDVPLKLEPEMGKYFPVSDSGRDVLNALLSGACEAGCDLQTGARVTKIARDNDAWTITAHTSDGPQSWRGATLILCSGGKALPKSGSDGAGYGFARQFGHTLIATTPALSPLLCDAPTHADLSGVTMPMRLSMHESEKPNAKPLAAYDGSFLFTHRGYSGPVALNVSRHFARELLHDKSPHLRARLLPDVPHGGEGAWWHNFVRDHAKKSLGNALSNRLPSRVVEIVAKTSRVSPSAPVGKLDSATGARVRDTLLSMPLPVSRVADYAKAEATAGGVALDELNPATMESRLTPTLFFAGEICDVDGWLGGYNFQWAWSSGAVAGRSAARVARRASD